MTFTAPAKKIPVNLTTKQLQAFFKAYTKAIDLEFSMISIENIAMFNAITEGLRNFGNKYSMVSQTTSPSQVHKILLSMPELIQILHLCGRVDLGYSTQDLRASIILGVQNSEAEKYECFRAFITRISTNVISI